MPDRIVKTTLIIDEHGAVKAVHGVGEESGRTEHKLSQLDKGVKGLGKSFGGLKSLLAGGVGLLGVGGAAYGIKSVVDNTKEALEQTEKFSAISGTGAQQSLYLTAALKARGVNAEAAGKAFAFLGSNIKTAERQEHGFAVAQAKTGAKGKITTSLLGKQAEAFRQLFGGRGVNVLSGLTGEQKLSTVVKAFERLPEAIKRTGAQAALMKEIFGRGGLSLATVLQGGATGLTHFEEVAKRFFPQLKGGQKGLEEWMVKNSEFHLGLEGLEFTLGMKLIPILKSVEEWFTKVSLEIKAGKGTWGEIARAVETAVGWLKSAWHTFEDLVGPANAAKGAIAGLVGVFAVGKVGSLVADIKKIGGAFALINPELVALGLAVGGVYEAYKHAEEIRGFFGLGGTRHVYKGPGGQPSSQAKVEAEATRAYFREGLDLPRQILEQRAHHEGVFPGERAALQHQAAIVKIDSHMDSVKIAETILHNPRAARIVAESTARVGASYSARK